MNDIDELIAVATSEEDEQQNRELSNRKALYHLDRFIKVYKIKAGSVKVPIYKIMYEYYHWKGIHKSKRVSSIEVGRIFSQYFDKHRSGKYRYYLLNDCFDMSKEAMKEAKDYYKKWHISYRKNKRDKEKEIEGKVSEPEETV